MVPSIRLQLDIVSTIRIDGDPFRVDWGLIELSNSPDRYKEGISSPATETNRRLGTNLHQNRDHSEEWHHK